MEELFLRRLSPEIDLADFNCGLEIMDNFIHNKLQDILSAHQNYSGYYLCYENEIVALFVVDIETIILDEDDLYDIQLAFGEEQVAGIEYNTLEILYLAVKKSYRNKGIGTVCIDKIIGMAQQSSALGVKFITVDAYKSSNYTATPFYAKHHFINAEYINPNKDTIRMIRPVNVKDYEEE